MIGVAAQAVVAKHSTESTEHYTPGEISSAARTLMGAIDLDPASCKLANDQVRAITFYDERANGFRRPWHGRIWLNPPGGRCDPDGRSVRWERMGARLPGQSKGIYLYSDGTRCTLPTQPSTKAWWSMLVAHYLGGQVSEAVFLGFNLEVLQSTQLDCKRSVFSFPICIPRRRIAFLYVDHNTQRLKVGGGPTHANVLAWLPPRDEYGDGAFDDHVASRWRSAFSWLGECRA